MTECEILRRMVLAAPDGHRPGIAEFLNALGFSVGAATVRGARLTVYLGGQEPNPPDYAERLVRTLGGRVTTGSSPIDRGWYEWHWVADIYPEVPECA